MSDKTTSGSTPPEAPAANAGAPAAPVADWGADSGANRGSGLARGKRVTPQASQAPVNNTAASGTYQPSSVQVLKSETEYQNPFASADVAPVSPAPVAAVPVAPVVVAPSAPVASVASAVVPAAPAVKAELNILPPAEVKRPASSWESKPAFPYEGDSPAAPTAAAPKSSAPRAESPLAAERPVFRPVRRSDVPMLERAPDASGKAQPREDFHGGKRQGRGDKRGGGQGRGNRPQQRDGGQRQPRQDRGPAAPGALPPSGNPQSPQHSQPASGKKPSGLFGWVKGLFGTAPEPGKPSLPGAQMPNAQPGEGGPDGNRRRRRRGGRGRSGGGSPQGGPNGAQGGNPGPQGQHGQGQPHHGHGGGEQRPQGQGGGRRRGGRGRGRSGGGQSGPNNPGGPGGGHRHDGGGSGMPPSA